ncbi:phage replication protein O [Vreelandella titanicae]|nr:phage replication protein O [Halomonas titanicae]
MSNLAHISDHERYQVQNPPAPERRSIQVEDGYTRTANAIVEAFMRAPLTSREARVIRVIERMTYGWNKPEDWIAASVISDMTGMPEGKCSETLNNLIRKKVVTRNGGGRSPVRINKEVSEWDFTAQRSRVTPKQKANPEWGESPQNGVSQSPQDGVTPKDRKYTLEPKGSKSSSKKPSPKKWGEEIDHELAEFMHATVTADLTNPKKPNLTAWANDIRLMRTRDGRTVEQIRYLIKWVSKDSFWKTNVLCPSKLREKWDQLELKVIAYKESRHGNRSGTDEKRANQDRIAAMLSDPNDTSWIEGLFPDEESGDLGAGEQGVHPTGSDLSRDMEESVFDAGHGEAGEAGNGYFHGEVVNAANDQEPGRGAGADQGRGWGVAAERGETDCEPETAAGGFWNA